MRAGLVLINNGDMGGCWWVWVSNGDISMRWVAAEQQGVHAGCVPRNHSRRACVMKRPDVLRVVLDSCKTTYKFLPMLYKNSLSQIIRGRLS